MTWAGKQEPRSGPARTFFSPQWAQHRGNYLAEDIVKQIWQLQLWPGWGMTAVPVQQFLCRHRLLSHYGFGYKGMESSWGCVRVRSTSLEHKEGALVKLENELHRRSKEQSAIEKMKEFQGRNWELKKKKIRQPMFDFWACGEKSGSQPLHLCMNQHLQLYQSVTRILGAEFNGLPLLHNRLYQHNRC